MRTKKKVGAIVGVIALIGVGGFLYFHNSASAAIGNLNIYNGEADIVRAGATITGASGTDIELSDTITVPLGSRVSIVLKDGSEVRLESGTTITVSDITYNGQKLSSAIFDMKSGEAWSHVSPLAPGGTFEVETPTVVATVRGTSFDVAYDGSESQVYVSTHAVWVALRSDLANTLQLNAGSFIVIHDSSATADFAAGPQSNFISDDWVVFNENLDGPAESDGAGAVTSTATTPSSSISTPTSTPRTVTPKQIPPTSKPTSSVKTSANAGVTVQSLALNAQNLSIDQNDVDPLTVTATYSDGTTANVTKQVSWKESPALNIIDTQGNLHASFTGTTAVTAVLAGIQSNTLEIMVGQAAQQSAQPKVTLSSIAVTCTKSSQSFTTAQYLPDAQCTASGSYSDGSNQDLTNQVAWSVSGTAAGSIDSAGYYTPEAEGTATITATLDGVVGSTQISIP